MTDSRETIKNIRTLLEELEDCLLENDQMLFAQNFDALEIPDLVASVVDYLQPLLHPYEAAIYWFLFRKSVIANGQQFARASTRGLCEGVIQSSSGKTDRLSYGSVKNAIMGLEKKGVISKAGDTNREGTLYRVHLPEEIGVCQQLMKEKEKTSVPLVDERQELDYYNVPENRLKVFERDNYRCYYCKKQLTRFTASLDHIQPVSEGGDNSFDNLTTACLHCNSRRGSRPVMDILTKKSDGCVSFGLKPLGGQRQCIATLRRVHKNIYI